MVDVRYSLQGSENLVWALNIRCFLDIQEEMSKRHIPIKPEVQGKGWKQTYKYGSHQCLDNFQITRTE